MFPSFNVSLTSALVLRAARKESQVTAFRFPFESKCYLCSLYQ